MQLQPSSFSLLFLTRFGLNGGPRFALIKVSLEDFEEPV